jgi:hypothetical protein
VGRAELIADGGAAARSDDLFRSEQFLAVEGVTHTMRLSAGDFAAAVPLIVREIEGSDRLDATSPYGYPGALLGGDGTPPDPSAIDWTESGLVSIFARERVIGPAWAARAAERSELQLHDPAKPRAVRPRLAEQIRANDRAGWEARVLPGPDADTGARDAFAVAYEQTMVRARAADRYFFGREYLDAILSFGASWLLLAVRGEEPGAAAIAARSDGVLHYYLGGTADAALDGSPFKNVVAALLDLADELEVPLNLGGGVTPGDGLERFKRGFANAAAPFRTHEIICDPAEYERLSAGRETSGFFPAYRAP